MKNIKLMFNVKNKINEKCHPMGPRLDFNKQGDWVLIKLFI